MSKDFNFDFCIIPNPFSNNGRNMIFITKSGENFLDRTIKDTQEYVEIKGVLEQFGYTEISHLQFETSDNNELKELSITEMREVLESFDLLYSRELEVNVIRDLSNLKEEANRVAKENYNFAYSDGDMKEIKDIPIGEKTKEKLIKSNKELFEFKYKEPDFKEKISLYFYLFIEFGFNPEGKPVIQFGGDFKDSEDYDDRNYIKIVKSEFERVRDKRKPNSIILVSQKTQSELLKEIGILYRGYFKYQQRVDNGDEMVIKEKIFPYKLAEIKKFLKPDKSIIVETNRMGYDRLINLSKKIKAESIIEANRPICTGDIAFEAEELSQFLTQKMEELSNKEEFEDAALMKKDVELINDKISYVKNLNKIEITTEEYFKNFSIS